MKGMPREARSYNRRCTSTRYAMTLSASTSRSFNIGANVTWTSTNGVQTTVIAVFSTHDVLVRGGDLGARPKHSPGCFLELKGAFDLIEPDFATSVPK